MKSAAPSAVQPPSLRLAQVADKLGRLRPDWNNPDRFFEERSDLEHELRSIERELR